jgi:hypothetical protein
MKPVVVSVRLRSGGLAPIWSPTGHREAVKGGTIPCDSVRRSSEIEQANGAGCRVEAD